MTEHNYTCDVKQAMNFNKDGDTVVGHLISIKIGGVALKADMKPWDPEKVKEGVKVAAVGCLSKLNWPGGMAEPITISYRVSRENMNLLKNLKIKDLPDDEVAFKFSIWKYDPETGGYYKAFHASNRDLKGVGLKQDGECVMGVNDNRCMDVPSPENYEASISILPDEEGQEINTAVSTSDKFAKKWGVSVGSIT